MHPIGGYFELELPNREEYHKDAIRLNTGRNAFEYILRAKKYKKVFLPYYTCNVMLEPIMKLNLSFEFYHIGKDFIPLFDYNIVNHEAVFLYTNYFGLCDKIVWQLSQKCKNLIVDNSQAFYSKPLPGVDTFYSARKFFGVPDGAYLYTEKLLDDEVETDISFNRFEHLLGRIDIGAEEFYATFKKNNEDLSNQPIKKMSNLTLKMLSGIDYQHIAETRKQNFNYLHSCLEKSNQLNLELESSTVPLIYPYLVNDGENLKKILIQNKVFVATYWPNVKDLVSDCDHEAELLSNLLAIPIDQRYSTSELKIIVSIISNHA